MNHEKVEPCYVILRTDLDSRDITVKLVTWSEKDAEEQVVRLNGLNAADKDCCYHWLKSRALRRAPV